jgi:hypothetical protein
MGVRDLLPIIRTSNEYKACVHEINPHSLPDRDLYLIDAMCQLHVLGSEPLTGIQAFEKFRRPFAQLLSETERPRRIIFTFDDSARIHRAKDATLKARDQRAEEKGTTMDRDTRFCDAGMYSNRTPTQVPDLFSVNEVRPATSALLTSSPPHSPVSGCTVCKHASVRHAHRYSRIDARQANCLGHVSGLLHTSRRNWRP